MINFLDLAIKEAEKSFKNNDFPVGAVLTIDGNIVGSKNWQYAEARGHLKT